MKKTLLTSLMAALVVLLQAWIALRSRGELDRLANARGGQSE